MTPLTRSRVSPLYIKGTGRQSLGDQRTLIGSGRLGAVDCLDDYALGSIDGTSGPWGRGRVRVKIISSGTVNNGIKFGTKLFT